MRRVKHAAKNPIGTTGLGISILGAVFTCGVLCPLGLLVSLFGLFHKPREVAIAGAIIGGLGSSWLVFCAVEMVKENSPRREVYDPPAAQTVGAWETMFVKKTAKKVDQPAS